MKGLPYARHSLRIKRDRGAIALVDGDGTVLSRMSTTQTDEHVILEHYGKQISAAHSRRWVAVILWMLGFTP